MSWINRDREEATERKIRTFHSQQGDLLGPQHQNHYWLGKLIKILQRNYEFWSGKRKYKCNKKN
jgi:hypothetical protein